MVSFYAEELGNINILRATILTEQDCNLAESLEIKGNVLSFDSTVIADLSTVGLSISTENLIVSSVTDSQSEFKAWDVKMCLTRQVYARSQQTEAKEWWSTAFLRSLAEECEEFTCKMCRTPLFKVDKEYKLKDLPSEHWYELVECWICHETNPDEHKTRMRPILARPRLVLVGSTYFLLYPDDISKENIEIDNIVARRLNWDRGTITKWTAINCKNCRHAVGEGQVCMEDEQMQLMAVKLFKYSISISPKMHEQDFVDFFVSDLINTAKIHATHKFIIQGRQSERNFALIWLFNWDTHIIYKDTTSNILKKKRVMKVMYLDCCKKMDEGAAKSVQMWSNDKSTDQLVYPDVYCNELLSTLKESTLILPSFMRKMDHPAMIFTRNFSVGFIDRRS